MSETKSKIGEGHASGMLRLGFNELGNAFVHPDSNIAQRHAEYGLFGHPTPAEIDRSIHGKAGGRDMGDGQQEHSALDQKLRELDNLRDDPGMDQPGMDRER